MEFAKANIFEKTAEITPIGLCSLGLQRKKQTVSDKKQKIYPRFFNLGKVIPN